MAKTYKLHARVTKEIEVTEAQMQRLCCYLCGCVENSDIDSIKNAFLEGTDSGSYEAGYIPQDWIRADLEQLDEANEIKMYFEENQTIFDDIDLS